MRRLLRRSVLAAAVAAGSAAAGGQASAAPPAPEPAPDIDDDSGIVPIPVGCPVPDPSDVVFVGAVEAKDEFIEKGTVRFTIEQLRAGDTRPFAVDGRIDVRYGPDSQYLDVGEQYLVAAAVDPAIGVLVSKVTPDAPLFGGDAVIGLEDDSLDCPDVDDPVMTLHPDGTSVDSGLLDPLLDDRRLLLATIGVPFAVVAAALVGLVILRRAAGLGLRGVFALGRRAVTPVADHRAARVRRHDSSID